MKNSKLAKKMLIIYSLSFGILCLFSLGAIQVTLQIYESKLYVNSLKELDFFIQTVEGELNDVEKTSFSIAMDYDIQMKLAAAMDIVDLDEYSFQMYQFKIRLQMESLNSNGIQNIIYTDKKKIQYSLGKKMIEIPEDRYNKILEETSAANGAYVSISPTEEFQYVLSGRDIRKYTDASLEYLGTLLLVTDLNEIVASHKNQLEESEAGICIYSSDGMIYQKEDGIGSQLQKTKLDQLYQIVNINHKKYFVCYLSSELTGWTYVNYFPYNQIYQTNTMIRYVMIFGYLLLFLLYFIIMKKLSGTVLKPIENLAQSMRIVESGEFEKAKILLDDALRKDEIGLLNQEFNIMLDKIRLLIHENYEKQILLKDTQYKALQAQMNPHFLYNTLNSINIMIKVQRNEEASKMIVSLGELLRAALSQKTVSTVQDEIDLVQSYIDIQKIRYKNRANFYLESEGNFKDYQLPKLILQPLVENAIYHGVDQSIRNCNVYVRVREENSMIYMEVEDDGPGMNKEEYKKMLDLKQHKNGNGIGLQNIINRLQLFFEEVDIEVKSEVGMGTKVSITIHNGGSI